MTEFGRVHLTPDENYFRPQDIQQIVDERLNEEREME